MSRPSVLFLACHLPYPPISGGRRRELELIRRISQDFDVHLMVASKTHDQDTANVHELESHCVRVEVFATDAMPADVAEAAEPPQVLRHRCPAMTDRVRRVIEHGAIDLIHVEGFYLMQHVPPATRVPVLLDEQNIEYDLERQRSSAGGRAHDMRTYRAEVAAWRRATMLSVLTHEDRDMLVGGLPGARVHMVPDGADHLPRPARGDARVDRSRDPLLVFPANFGYEPNVDATLHFCRDILPRVHDDVPDARLWLVGTDPPPEVKALAGDRVRVTGRVPDVAPYLDAADVVVCPLRIGGGVKVKAIEALRRGRCVVSSSVGAQGMPPAARDALAVADDPGAFARAVTGLLIDPHRRAHAETLSARAATTLSSWDSAADALAAAYDELLGAEARVLERVG